MPVHVVGFTKEVHKLMRAADFLIGKPGPGSIAEAMVRKLPVLIECNAWTLPQERYNAEWVTEKRVGIVLKELSTMLWKACGRCLEPARLAEFRKNVAALNNRAIFEIPEMLAKLLGESEETADAVCRASDSIANVCLAGNRRLRQFCALSFRPGCSNRGPASRFSTGSLKRGLAQVVAHCLAAYFGDSHIFTQAWCALDSAQWQ